MRKGKTLSNTPCLWLWLLWQRLRGMNSLAGAINNEFINLGASLTTAT